VMHPVGAASEGGGLSPVWVCAGSADRGGTEGRNTGLGPAHPDIGAGDPHGAAGALIAEKRHAGSWSMADGCALGVVQVDDIAQDVEVLQRQKAQFKAMLRSYWYTWAFWTQS
jgi:hypothetical protein